MWPRSTSLRADKFDQVMNLNLHAPINLARLVYREMVRLKTEGRIINIASVHGHIATEGTSNGKTAYITAKHGLIGFTKALCARRQAARHCRQQHQPRLCADADF